MKEFPSTEEIEKMDDIYKKKIAKKIQERMNISPEFKAKCESSQKTLTGILKYCKEEARKQAQDGVAVIDDDEVYQWAYHYIEEDSLDYEEKPKPPVVKKVKKEDQKDLFAIEPEKAEDSDSKDENEDGNENDDEKEEILFEPETKPEPKPELVQNSPKEDVPEQVSQLSLFNL